MPPLGPAMGGSPVTSTPEPTNAAFEKLPAGTVDKLVQPDMKATLTKILTYHVVAGKMTSSEIAKAIEDGGLYMLMMKETHPHPAEREFHFSLVVPAVCAARYFSLHSFIVRACAVGAGSAQIASASAQAHDAIERVSMRSSLAG